MKKSTGKILLTGDIHAHTHRLYSRTDDEGMNSRLKHALEVIRFMLNYGLEHGIDRMIFAGDLFDTKNRVPMLVVNAVFNEFSKWIPYGMRVLMIPGNHDHAVRSGKHHGLDIFRHIPGFVVVDEPCSIEWEGLYVRAVPYREDLEINYFQDKNISEDNFNVCVAHGCVEGACHIPYALPKDPTEPSGEWIRRSWLRQYDLSVIGHVHHPKSQKDGQRQILIPGCPYQDSIIAEGENRGIWTIDLETRQLEQIKVPGMPEFISIELHEDRDLTEDEYQKCVGNISLIKPQTHTISKITLQNIKEKLYERGSVYVAFPSLPVSIELESSIEPRIPMGSKDTPQTVLRKVIHSDLVNLRDQPKEEIVALGDELINEVEEMQK